MNVSVVSTTRGGTTATLGARSLRTPSGEPARRVFRAVLYLRLATGGMAEAMVFDEATTTLQGTFSSDAYNAVTIGTDTGLRASVSASGNGAVVTLDAPRRVRQITLADDKVHSSGYTLELYRLDGDVLAPAPSATDVNQAFGPIHEFSGAPERTIGGIAGGSEGAVVTASAESSGSPRLVKDFSTVFSVDFTDARFALRLKAPGGAAVSLSPDDVTAIQIGSPPSGPRIGIVFPVDAAGEAAGFPGVTFFWRAPGEVADGSPEATATAGPALATELARAARSFRDRLRDAQPPGSAPPVLPATLDAALVIESDSPCRLTAGVVSLAFRLARESFPDGADKRVMKFDGAGQLEAEAVITAPGAASCAVATIRTAESFRDERAASGVGAGEPITFDDARRGIRVDGRRGIAHSIVPAQALTVSGVAVAVMGLAARTELRVELREDAAGQPGGRRLAAATVALDAAGVRRWATATFAASVIVPAVRHWIVLTSAAGQAVWLTRDAADAISVLETVNGDGQTATARTIEGVQTMLRLLSRAESALGEPAVSLRVGDVLVAGVDENGGRVYDAAAAMTAFLAGRPAGTPADVRLRVTSALPGIVTLYPPRIEYG